MYIYIHSVCTQYAYLILKRHESASYLLELELHIFLSHPMWVLGTKLGSPRRAVLLTQLSYSQTCQNNNTEDNNSPLLLLTSIT